MMVIVRISVEIVVRILPEASPARKKRESTVPGIVHFAFFVLGTCFRAKLGGLGVQLV